MIKRHRWQKEKKYRDKLKQCLWLGSTASHKRLTLNAYLLRPRGGSESFSAGCTFACQQDGMVPQRFKTAASFLSKDKKEAF
ncbi:MAG: hypothetical protein ACXV5H_08535 [Halobacteriota archaeon]